MDGHSDVITKGIWWKSLLVAWLVTWPIGWVVAELGAEPPDAVGFAVFGVAWVISFVALRRRARQGRTAKVRSPLRDMQRLTVAYAFVTVALGIVVDTMRRDDAVPSAGLDPAPAAAALALVATAVVMALAVGLPSLRGTEADELVARYHSRFLVRLGLAEFPALMAFASVLLTGAPAVYFFGLVGSLVGIFIVIPTKGRIQRDQARQSEAGSPPDVLGLLTQDSS